MPQPSLPVSAGFLAIVATLLALLAACVRAVSLGSGAELHVARRRAAWVVVVAVGWLALTAALALSGVLAELEAMPPRLTLVVGPPLVAAVVIALTRPGRELALGLPTWLLVGYQAFRVPVEILLHRLFQEGVIPVQMTWSGRNLDVLTGVSAIPIAWLASRGRVSRGVLWAWNVAGLALLVNIVTIAILSMPYPFRRFLEGPPNAVVLDWPLAWLPAFVVPCALLGHLLLARRLAATAGQTAA